MDFWFWLLLGLVVAVGGVSIWLRRLRGNNAALFAQEVTPERARAASARLSEPQHREVYRFLASDHLLGAAQAIKQATNATARDCLLDAQALRSYPQVWTPQASAPAEDAAPGADAAPEGSTAPLAPAADGVEAGREPDASADAATAPEGESAQTPDAPESSAEDGSASLAAHDLQPRAEGDAPASGNDPAEDWSIPEDWAQEYGGEHAGERHMEFTHHDGTELRRFSTQELPAAERDQLMSQLRDGELAAAAKLIADRVGIDPDEVEVALRANHESGHDRVDGIAVRFDRGDGEAVEFSTQSLPEEERNLFISALHADDLITAAQVVSRHTGISPEQALTLLETFRRRRD